MAIMAKKPDNPNYKVVAENRRARYDYAIEEDIECGIVLEGSEVKSLRTGKAQIAGELTVDSTAEQASAGLDRCSAEELALLRARNAAYRERFASEDLTVGGTAG